MVRRYVVGVPLWLVALVGCFSSEVSDDRVPVLSAYPTVSEILAATARGESVTDVVESALERAEGSASLNALIHVDAAGAIDAARALESDRHSTHGLYGVPVVVKDNIHLGGLPNTAGTPGLAKFVPARDHAAVAALRRSGAIVLGKANLHELAFGITSDNATFGPVANPYDTSRFAGGSSGGTAAAIAAGIVPAGLGTDTGGSVRIPAALTGIVGFRPTTDRYGVGDVTPISRTRDVVGVMARTVAGVRALDRAIVPRSGPRSSNPPPDTIRLGVPRAYFYQSLEHETGAVMEACLTRLAGAGIVLVDVEVPDLSRLIEASAFPIALYEVARDLPEYLQTHATGRIAAVTGRSGCEPRTSGMCSQRCWTTWWTRTPTKLPSLPAKACGSPIGRFSRISVSTRWFFPPRH